MPTGDVNNDNGGVSPPATGRPTIEQFRAYERKYRAKAPAQQLSGVSLVLVVDPVQRPPIAPSGA